MFGNKKKKANPFLMFMLDYQRRNNMNIAEAQIAAGEIWKDMSTEERQTYSTKKVQQVKQPNRFELEAEQSRLDIARETKNMEKAIEEMVQTGVEKEEFKAKPFFFFSTTYFIQTLNHEIFPAELAMAKFSLNEGIIDTLHLMINPGTLPMGSAGPAMLISEKTHLRPLPPDTEGEKDYKIILKKIMSFIGKSFSSGSFPPFFVKPSHVEGDIEAAMMTLEKILVEAGVSNFRFRVYPINELFSRLYKQCNEVYDPSLSTVFYLDLLSRENYLNHDIGCSFHQEKDANSKCCLAKVISWGLTILQYCTSQEVDSIISSDIFENESVSGSDDWLDDISDNLQNMRIESVETIHRNSSLLSIASTKESLDSEDSKAPLVKASEFGSSADVTNLTDEPVTELKPTADPTALYSKLMESRMRMNRMKNGVGRGMLKK